ncbi:MAG: hypothetical protein HY092_02025 [Candidatus Kerfeldbacteria bacterium]|nr:hypothetical protein [Candidatus Kerfeldbacteria bacterium]
MDPVPLRNPEDAFHPHDPESGDIPADHSDSDHIRHLEEHPWLLGPMR